MKQDKILLFVDYNRMDNISKITDNECDKINANIIPLLKALEFDITLQNICLYAGNNDKLQEAYLRKELSRIKGESEIIRELAIDRAKARFEEANNKYIYDDFEVIQSKFIILQENKAIPNEEAIKEHCTHYLADEYREQYNQLQGIAERLTEWGNGKLESLDQILYVTRQGEVKVNNRIDYPRFKSK